MSHHVTQCTKLRKSLQPHTSISRQRHGQNHYLPFWDSTAVSKGHNGLCEQIHRAPVHAQHIVEVYGLVSVNQCHVPAVPTFQLFHPSPAVSVLDPPALWCCRDPRVQQHLTKVRGMHGIWAAKQKHEIHSSMWIAWTT